MPGTRFVVLPPNAERPVYVGSMGLEGWAIAVATARSAADAAYEGALIAYKQAPSVRPLPSGRATAYRVGTMLASGELVPQVAVYPGGRVEVLVA